MNLEVYKFGGSALATRKNFDTLYSLIKRNDNKKIIVVSAMGRSGFPYATDSLLNLVNQTYLTKEEYHRLLANGEIISSVVFNNYLKEKGLNSYCVSYLNNGIFIKDDKINLDSTDLKRLIKEYDYLIVPGFVAKNEEREAVTLGRGNSDLTAVLIAKMFDLKQVSLFKDVDGIYPFVHYPLKSVKPYESITSKELEVMISNGVKAVSLDALHFAVEYDINLHVVPFENDNHGTIVEIDNTLKKKYIGFVIDNKTFKLLCADPIEVKEIMHDHFLKMHVLVKKEEIDTYKYSFLLKSSQNLLLKKRIINTFFKDYFLENC